MLGCSPVCSSTLSDCSTMAWYSTHAPAKTPIICQCNSTTIALMHDACYLCFKANASLLLSDASATCNNPQPTIIELLLSPVRPNGPQQRAPKHITLQPLWILHTAALMLQAVYGRCEGLLVLCCTDLLYWQKHQACLVHLVT